MIESRPLRVCVLSEFFYPDNGSGTGKAVADIARRLVDEHGFQIDVLCGNRLYLTGAKLSKSEPWGGIRIRRISYPNWNRSGVAKRSICNIIFALKAGTKLIFGPGYDAILVTTAPPFLPIAARMARAIRRTPYAYLIYDLEPDRAMRLGAVDAQGLSSRVLGRFQKSWLTKSQCVIAIGRCMKDLIEQSYGVAPEKIKVIPVGSEESGISYVPYQPIDPENPRKFRVVYSGNLGRYHDFDTLLDSAKEVATEPFEFIIVGQGARREHVDGRIREEGISNVTTLDFKSHKEYEALLASADACFVTMEKGIEGTCVPSKFYSIMASGRATLASSSPDTEIAYTLADHGLGVRVLPGSVVELTEALRSMAGDPAKVKLMADRSREAFLGHYTTKISVSQLRLVLENMMVRRTDGARRTKPEDVNLVSANAPSD